MTGLFPAITVSAIESNTSDIEEVIDGIVTWKKSDVGAAEGESIFTDRLLALAGTTPGDWYPFGLGRYGYAEDYTPYLAVVGENVERRYATSEKLSRVKATEWHRIALAVTAAGGDPRHMGEDGTIDLIADGTYNRALTVSPGKQGINGWIWGLIALDSRRYEVPEGAADTREDFIVEILRTQRADGGFALTGTASDVDMTAMAVQALAPYYPSERVFSYTSSVRKGEDGTYTECEKTVREVIDESVAWLSSVQCADGDFSSWGTQNVESTAQVLVALCTLGIDALHDSRFIKSGHTLLDGILKYRLPNGGFVHSFTYDPDNPSSLPDKANTMAGEQVLYSLVSLWRYRRGMRSLYDLREEFSTIERLRLDACMAKINLLDDTSTKETVADAVSAYREIPALDRFYVNNYVKLVTYSAKYDIELPADAPDYSGGGGEEETPLLYFSETNRRAADALPEADSLTTEYSATVSTLRYLLSNCEDFDGKEAYEEKVDRAYHRILEIRAEIDALKADIKEKLYPFDAVTLSDREEVHALYDRYFALSEYDRGQLDDADREGLLKCKTQVDTLYLALVIGGISLVLAAAITLIVVVRIRNRRKARAEKKMPESEE